VEKRRITNFALITGLILFMLIIQTIASGIDNNPTTTGGTKGVSKCWTFTASMAGVALPKIEGCP
jgi:hypothetical protein